MSIAESLESFLLHAETRTGQKTAETWDKMKKTLGERRYIFFSSLKGLNQKRRKNKA